MLYFEVYIWLCRAHEPRRQASVTTAGAQLNPARADSDPSDASPASLAPTPAPTAVPAQMAPTLTNTPASATPLGRQHGDVQAANDRAQRSSGVQGAHDRVEKLLDLDRRLQNLAAKGADEADIMSLREVRAWCQAG